MTIEIWVQIAIAVIGLVVIPLLLGLIKILHMSLVTRIQKIERDQERLEDRLEDRLRSIGHRLEDLRSTIQGITELFIDKNNGK